MRVESLGPAPRSARSSGPAGPRRPGPTGPRWEPRLPDGAAGRPRRRRPGPAGTPAASVAKPPACGVGRCRADPLEGDGGLLHLDGHRTAQRRGRRTWRCRSRTASRASCASLRAGTTARCHSASTPFFRRERMRRATTTMATTSTTMRTIRPHGVLDDVDVVVAVVVVDGRGGGPGRVGRRGGRRRRRGGDRHGGGGGGRRGRRGRGPRWWWSIARGRPATPGPAPAISPGHMTASPTTRAIAAVPPAHRIPTPRPHLLMGRSSRSRRRAARSSSSPERLPDRRSDRSRWPAPRPGRRCAAAWPGSSGPPRRAAG